jgi:c(7)-type cytochrome triheme protein
VKSLSFVALTQGSNLDYSTFRHNSARHASLSCNACHQRTDNSITPKFPSHPACINCHSAQFFTPGVPMCSICHVDVKSVPPPLKAFPAKFNESFNVKFDHAQHLTGAARPQNSCNGCHARGLRRGVGFTIPSGIAAHRQCYVCHTPSSQSSGRDLASCGVCHEQKGYARTSTNAASFRLGFSHADHGPRQRLGCTDCHKVTARAPQSRQVSSPRPIEHFPSGSTMSCVTCHNGRRAFGGDLAFADCKRCHEGTTFR